MSTADTTASSPRPDPRKPWSERMTGVIWAAIVTAGGGFLIAALSGYDVDLELIAIVALVALGGWLLFSAIAVSMRNRPRRGDTWEITDPAPSPEPRSED
ncbi:hypothetical protein [Demequina lignilytica]|uniref:UsfY protein n=1 Tax=Demequina lignilytica TaxID=3051663 RepID=A0AAW7M931_9MICO|nr:MULTISPECIES: hypothetical protein [unclassified Demequina]MDN4478180.1 hypothetical protein [Demequina sp. SYSU T00039-1]MDN4482741.1 hypothetical protein [Demequina sp. SYSU T0a273]MDN4488370.1 hypothetical protein [Demequina sp. SYSU T00039]MDN4490083.1 hypothetical protein [Demequina sp. SYSU T00068]